MPMKFGVYVQQTPADRANDYKKCLINSGKYSDEQIEEKTLEMFTLDSREHLKYVTMVMEKQNDK